MIISSRFISNSCSIQENEMNHPEIKNLLMGNLRTAYPLSYA
jgi:hypothetical protein